MENSEMSEICLFFQILTVVITQDLTEQKTEVPIQIKRKKKNFRDF